VRRSRARYAKPHLDLVERCHPPLGDERDCLHNRKSGVKLGAEVILDGDHRIGLEHCVHLLERRDHPDPGVRLGEAREKDAFEKSFPHPDLALFTANISPVKGAVAFPFR